MADENPILNNPYEGPRFHYATTAVSGEETHSSVARASRLALVARVLLGLRARSRPRIPFGVVNPVIPLLLRIRLGGHEYGDGAFAGLFWNAISPK